jgi:DNA-binding MarR family transcriptional regulator
VASQAGLTPERYDLLLMIQAGVEAGAPVRVTDLCESLQLRQTAVTENLKRAVEAGLIERRPSPDDGRASHLHLTEEGERRLRAAYEGLRGDRAMLRRAFSDLDLTFRASSR